MEKRTLLAIILSLMVLLGYNSLFIRHPYGQSKPELLQNIVNKEVTYNTTQKFPSSPLPAIETQPTNSISEETESLENNNLIITFSNIGAAIKSVKIKEFDDTLPVTRSFEVSGFENVPFTLLKKSQDQLIYSYVKGPLKIIKEFDLSKGSYLLKSIISFSNLSEMSNLNNVSVSNFSIDFKVYNNKSALYSDRTLFEYSIAKDGTIFRKNNAFSFSEKENQKQLASVKWVGFRDRFFCAIIKPEFSTVDYNVTRVADKILKIETQLGLPQNSLENTKNYNFTAYFGPQDIKQLKSYNMGFEDIVSFSGFGIVDFISKTILNIMRFIHKVIPSWGACIILICTLVYFAMYPLTFNGMKSMRKMQTLQPRMAQLKEQHKNNPQKLNKEIMELYKENHVNPFSGCLPFLLQMPVFIGLYQALWRTIDLKGHGFLWIKDLAAPDRLIILPQNLPIIGNEINIFPILMAIVMFLQQKVSMKNVKTTDPMQLSQQKMMATIFPVMLGFIFYKFSSGLTLYFTFFYAFSTITQWKMSKEIIKV